MGIRHRHEAKLQWLSWRVMQFWEARRARAIGDSMAARTGGAATLTGTGDPIQLRGARVSAHFFDIYGIQAERGRMFLPEEDERGKDRVLILSHVLWVNQFGADPSIVNRTIPLDNEPYAVIGVLPAGSAFDRAFNQLWPRSRSRRRT